MTEFIRNNETFLRELAEGYTGNSAKAKEIAAEAKSDADPVRKVRLLSVMYVQQRDLDLFEHEETPKAGAEELREVRDIGRELSMSKPCCSPHMSRPDTSRPGKSMNRKNCRRSLPKKRTETAGYRFHGK